MKFNLSKLYLPILALAIVGQSNVWANPELEKKVADSLEEFVDITKNPNKKWATYVEHWLVLLQGNPQYGEFCNLLKKIKASRSPMNIGVELQSFHKRHPHLIPATFLTLLEKYKAVLKDALRKRTS